jgi:hypothetical protein
VWLILALVALSTPVVFGGTVSGDSPSGVHSSTAPPGSNLASNVFSNFILTAMSSWNSDPVLGFAGMDSLFKDDTGPGNFLQTVRSVPEPMTLTLMGAGLLGLGFLGRRRMRK